MGETGRRQIVLLHHDRHWELLPILLQDYGDYIPPECRRTLNNVDAVFIPSRHSNWRGSGTPQPPRPPYPPAQRLHMGSAWGKFRIPPR
eukprot:5158642-Prorocentrum_lima.AAC.1